MTVQTTTTFHLNWEGKSWVPCVRKTCRIQSGSVITNWFEMTCAIIRTHSLLRYTRHWVYPFPLWAASHCTEYPPCIFQISLACAGAHLVLLWSDECLNCDRPETITQIHIIICYNYNRAAVTETLVTRLAEAGSQTEEQKFFQCN